MAYEKNGEWSGYSIKESKTGWIVTTWSRQQGVLDGRKILVPYGVYDYKKGVDLNLPHNNYVDAGEAIFEYSKSGSTNHIKVLRTGSRVK